MKSITTIRMLQKHLTEWKSSWIVILRRINKFYKEKAKYKECIVLVRKNDLTEERTDAIVNPANEELGHGGGAAKAIADKGGKVIWKECENYIKENKKLATGMAMVTNAGDLNCGYVIHAVGPIYDENDSKTAKKKMAEVIQNILQLMIERDFKSVSIPGISTGIYKFPLNKAAEIMCKTIKSFIDEHKSEMKGRQIIFCNFDDKTTDVFAKYVPKIFSENEDLNPEPDDYAPKPSKCSNCNHKIKDISHQRKRKHLDICLKCYEELKREKVDQPDKSDDSREEVKEGRIKARNDKRSKSPEYKENSLKKKKKNRIQSDDSDKDEHKSEKKNKKNIMNLINQNFR